MKTLKTILIVLVTLTGIGVTLFFKGTLIAGAFQFHQDPVESPQKKAREELETKVQSKLDSIKKARLGKNTKLATYKTYQFVHTYVAEYGDVESTLVELKPGDKVRIVGDSTVFNRRIEVSKNGLRFYVDYGFLPPFRRVADIDTL